jgi:signal transduction histidine kinase
VRDDRVKEENTANEERTNLNTALENYLRTSSRLRTAALSYLLGFDAALHARNRCKEFDQIGPR